MLRPWLRVLDRIKVSRFLDDSWPRKMSKRLKNTMIYLWPGYCGDSRRESERSRMALMRSAHRRLRPVLYATRWHWRSPAWMYWHHLPIYSPLTALNRDKACGTLKSGGSMGISMSFNDYSESCQKVMKVSWVSLSPVVSCRTSASHRSDVFLVYLIGILEADSWTSSTRRSHGGTLSARRSHPWTVMTLRAIGIVADSLHSISISDDKHTHAWRSSQVH
jgi:hypothetical protein